METQAPESPRIGVFNMPIVVTNSETAKSPVPHAERPNLIISGANLAPPADPPAILDASGEAIPSITWPEYIAWRKTKCRPFDYKQHPSVATYDSMRCNIDPDFDFDAVKARALEEIDQATHELVGEVAELGELMSVSGIQAFYGDRSKLIDECGDIFFCACWALDAWGLNPLEKAPEGEGVELLSPDEDDPRLNLGRFIATYPAERAVTSANFVHDITRTILSDMLAMQTAAGLTSNSFKKLRFQRREQSVETQVSRIAEVLMLTAGILLLAHSSVEEALKVNQKKINARYPNGQTGLSGGIRTGDGK